MTHHQQRKISQIQSQYISQKSNQNTFQWVGTIPAILELKPLKLWLQICRLNVLKQVLYDNMTWSHVIYMIVWHDLTWYHVIYMIVWHDRTWSHMIYMIVRHDLTWSWGLLWECWGYPVILPKLYELHILSTAWASITPHCRFRPLGTWISGSGITVGWLADVLFTHVHGVIILLALLI